MLCDERTLIAKRAGHDLKRGDVVYVGSDGTTRRSIGGDHSPFEKYIALCDAERGKPVAVFGLAWEDAE
jgi:hypothetical protein